MNKFLKRLGLESLKLLAGFGVVLLVLWPLMGIYHPAIAYLLSFIVVYSIGYTATHTARRVYEAFHK